jgi:hypothetical protein
LAITQFPPDPGFYLLYLDEAGGETTDTYHERIEDAMAQAHWEFGVESSEWESTS